MKKIMLIIITLLSTATGCNKFVFELGAKIPKAMIRNATHGMELTDSASLKKSYSIVYEGINYSVVLNDALRIEYIATYDNRFVTPEGIRIGMTLDEVLRITDGEMNKMRGWAYYMPLKSGWQIAFTTGFSMTDFEPSADEPVAFIFKTPKW